MENNEHSCCWQRNLPDAVLDGGSGIAMRRAVPGLRSEKMNHFHAP
jgi:hypothetical protein